MKICDDYAKNTEKAWNSYKKNRKIKLVNSFLVDKIVEHAKKSCKFFNDLGNLSGFGRNYSAASSVNYSGFLGRSILIGDFKRPALKIFSNKPEIYEFVDKCTRIPKKPKIVKKSKFSNKVVFNKR